MASSNILARPSTFKKFTFSPDFHAGEPLVLLSCKEYEFIFSAASGDSPKQESQVFTPPVGWKFACLSMCDFGLQYGSDVDDQHWGIGYFSIGFAQDGPTTKVVANAQLRDNDAHDPWSGWANVLVQFFGSIPATTAPPAPLTA